MVDGLILTKNDVKRKSAVVRHIERRGKLWILGDDEMTMLLRIIQESTEWAQFKRGAMVNDWLMRVEQAELRARHTELGGDETRLTPAQILKKQQEFDSAQKRGMGLEMRGRSDAVQIPPNAIPLNPQLQGQAGQPGTPGKQQIAGQMATADFEQGQGDDKQVVGQQTEQEAEDEFGYDEEVSDAELAPKPKPKYPVPPKLPPMAGMAKYDPRARPPNYPNQSIGRQLANQPPQQQAPPEELPPVPKGRGRPAAKSEPIPPRPPQQTAQQTQRPSRYPTVQKQRPADEGAESAEVGDDDF